jgi:uncharacterized membrane protein YphA (DoxX/SURF4 family)
MTQQEECEFLRPAAVGLASIRVWCGVWFLISSCLKFPLSGLSDWRFPEQLKHRAAALANEGAFHVYGPVLSFVQQHPTLCAALAGAVESVVGTLLVLGLFTRLSASLGIVVAVNYWLATGRLGASSVGLFVTLSVCLSCLILGDGGRFYGLDRFRLPKRRAETSPAIPTPGRDTMAGDHGTG